MDEDFFCEPEEEIARLAPDLVCVRLKEEVMRVARTGDFLFLGTPVKAHIYRIASIQYGDRRVVTLGKFSGTIDIDGQRALFAARMLEESMA